MDDCYLQWGRKLGNKAELGDLSPEALLTRNIWSEARGESLDNKQRVGCVVRNRCRWHIHKPMGDAVWAAIILAKYQFSWTNDDDPNLKKALDPLNPKWGERPEIWEACCVTASGIVSGILPDTTQGADFYVDRSLFHKTYKEMWGDDEEMVMTYEDDEFRFWRSARVKMWT